MTQRQYTRRTPSQWRKHVTTKASSDLSISAYCQQQGLAVSNFYHWRKKLLSTGPQLAGTEETPTPDDSWVALAPTTIDPPFTSESACHTAIKLSLPGGIQLTISTR